MRKILIIDDDELLREIVRLVLTERGFQVLEANDGEAGIRMAQQYVPDLILCDVKMDRVDGFGTLSELRADPLTANIPFILITGYSDPADMRHGMNLGADDYLTKPFTPQSLLLAVDTRLKKADSVRLEAERSLAQLRQSITVMLPHELLTPLNGIIGLGEVLAQGAGDMSPEEVGEIGRDITESSRRLQQLIDKYLAYVQVELLAVDPQPLEAEEKAIEAKPVVERCGRAQAARRGREKDLQLTLQDCRLAISDRNLSRIVDELVENAFKFSEPGSLVSVEMAPDKGWVQIRIHDRGRGFQPEQIRKIGAFMQFGRATQEQQGVGLGLYLAKRLAEFHGGSFSLNLTAEQESEVLVRLPLAKA